MRVSFHNLSHLTVRAPATAVTGCVHHRFGKDTGNINAVFVHGGKQSLMPRIFLHLMRFEAFKTTGRHFGGHHAFDAVNSLPPHLDPWKVHYGFHVSNKMALRVYFKIVVFYKSISHI